MNPLLDEPTFNFGGYVVAFCFMAFLGLLGMELLAWRAEKGDMRDGK